MPTSILATGNYHVQPVAHSVSEFVQATGAGDPFTPIKIIVTWLCVAVIVGCAICATFELRRYGELVHPEWVKVALGTAVLDLIVLFVLTAFTYL
ncbi:hypothetical protein [Corynebacterium bovis]|uniref:hypothetical protein n=1 Tax=Corynebacterium bovis TaxID=36808 RepID=UPI003138C1C3